LVEQIDRVPNKTRRGALQIQIEHGAMSGIILETWHIGTVYRMLTAEPEFSNASCYEY